MNASTQFTSLSKGAISQRLAEVVHSLTVGLISGATTGVFAALFLTLLAKATALRQDHCTLICALPVVGWVLGVILRQYGGRSVRGNNLVIETFFDMGPRLPRRMAPMVLLGTVATHLFGGSAGREGTAVQIGASLSDAWAHHFTATGSKRQDWLFSGVAAGFSSAFGTPLAACIFASEFFGGKNFARSKLYSSFTAAYIGDRVAKFLGVRHPQYLQPEVIQTNLSLLGKWTLFAIAAALASAMFLESVHMVKAVTQRLFPSLRWRLTFGGAVVALYWQMGGASECMGLGVDTIYRAFSDANLSRMLFLEKIFLTSVTVGTGFLGGEVTPLFFIGASLGNAMAPVLDLPIAMSAAVGMSALFASAAKAPIAMTTMAVELFGPSVFPHVLFVCLLTFAFNRRKKLYESQNEHPLIEYLHSLRKIMYWR